MGLGHADPALLGAAQDSFMAGLHAACLLVAGVCFVGAIAAAGRAAGTPVRATRAEVVEPVPETVGV